MKTIRLNPKTEELITLNNFIHEESSLNEPDINLIVEEIFVNIVNYSGCNYIVVNFELADDTFRISFHDDGIKFNPLAADDPKLPNSIDEAKIGGLGIHLVKNLADDISYEYTDAKNHLTIFKKVKK